MINANLIESMMTDCVMLDHRREPDEQGGFVTVYVPGVTFKAAITRDNTMQARIAEKQGVTSIYTVTTPRGVGLNFHEVFKRLEDGKIFRATSDWEDSKPPAAATFTFEQVSAEEWVIPK